MTGSLRRLYPGKRLEDTFQWSFENLDALESSFNVQEYLQQLIRKDPSDTQHIIELPAGVDEEVWQYEHLRQVCLELSLLIVALEPECTRQNCPEMKADGWLYLCAAHPSTQSCPAIDYITHTLDGATILLNNSKYFPSRISVPEPSLKHFQSIARRLYRVFAHAYCHHREVYESFENETYLYTRFLKLAQTYHLVPPNLISISSQYEDSTSKETEDTIYSRNLSYNSSSILLSQKEDDDDDE
ncbi:MOB-like protein phocein [Choanephora cucurbitarum]|uniref:MOB-like protein phocein n=1 Tax=Choanephora cucurbitarum TaxID=101091 RepID=A0A1C7NCS5_9FUNG|nr:MOB-like protein phocein [Choanephora cucurbitarum]